MTHNALPWRANPNATAVGLVVLGHLSVTLALGLSLSFFASDHLIGDGLDGWQSLWNFWWLRHFREFGDSPFFSRLLWWPNGVPLWTQTWDLPSAAVAVALWDLIPDYRLFNLIVLVTFPASAFTFYLLAHELFRSRVAAFCGSLFYSYSTFHFAHAQGQLHISSMEWMPLFVFSLIRSGAARPILRGALSGASLALCLLASPYYFVMSLMSAAFCVRETFHGGSRRTTILSCAVGIVTFLVGAGWLLVGMIRQLMAGPSIGNHNPVRFSSDLVAFFLPNPANMWQRDAPLWNGTPHETSAYVGYILMISALFGCVTTSASRKWFALGLFGFVLALGPLLKINGHVSGVTLPYAWLSDIVPFLSAGGLPSRYCGLLVFGFSLSAAAAFAHIQNTWQGGKVVCALLSVAALCEAWPRPLPVTWWDPSPVFATWASDHTQWAVLDVTEDARPLRNQMQHRHPIVGGYVTRLPKHLADELSNNRALRGLFDPPLGDGGPFVLRPGSLEWLRANHIRYVVMDERRAWPPTLTLLVPEYRGEGIAVFRVPDS